MDCGVHLQIQPRAFAGSVQSWVMTLLVSQHNWPYIGYPVPSMAEVTATARITCSNGAP